MKISEILMYEAIYNILPQDNTKRQQYANDVWEMIQLSYAPIGGIKGKGFKSIEDMMENIPFWKITIRNGEPNSVLMYKENNGRKRVAMATNGSSIGKKDLAKMLYDEYKTQRAYAEISGGSLKFHKKVLGDEFQQILLPSETALKIFDPEEIQIIDEYSYKRLIGSEWITKCLVGTLDADFPK